MCLISCTRVIELFTRTVLDTAPGRLLAGLTDLFSCQAMTLWEYIGAVFGVTTFEVS